jgi:Flp pilus assembly pilin Flp
MRKSQSMLEYTILMIIIVAAFITMQVYIKRGFQGRWKQAADDLGDQYDVNAFNSNVRYTLDSSTESTVCAVQGVTYNGQVGMMTSREDSSTSVEKKSGAAHMDAVGP